MPFRQTGLFNWTEFKVPPAEPAKSPTKSRASWAALATVILLVGLLALLLLVTG